MKYIGLDIHKDFCIATEMDKEGNILRENYRINTTQKDLQDYFSTIQNGTVAIESTGIWEYIYETIHALGFPVILVNPVKTRAIAEAKIKTDHVDSQILAHLLRSNLLPTVYIGDKKMRELKHLITERLFLTKQTTQLKNRITSELLRRGHHPHINIFTQKGRHYLHSLSIPSITRELTILESMETEIAAINTELKNHYTNTPQAHLLTTIPGIGYYTALSLIAIIGDITRFSTSEKLTAYLGLAPATHQSGNHIHHGPITKQGPAHLRWLLIQCTWIHVTKYPNSFLTRFYTRIAKKKGKTKAIVATTRKMTRVIYWILTNKEPFHSEGYTPRGIHADTTAVF